MRILIDITHPAHVHFFKNPIKILKDQGHEILITSRIKDNATELLDNFGFSHTVLTTASENKNLVSFAKELVKRDYLLSKLVKKNKPDVLGAIGGTFIAHAGFITKTPSIVFYDTENAKLQNLITYKFASIVITPMCYESWLPNNNIKYPGYHELSYLDPRYFNPDRGLAISNGLDPSKDNFFIRLVSWNANHDIGEKGITSKTLDKMVRKLSSYGNVIISSESELPPHIDVFKFKGEIHNVHHVLSQCKAYIGESATMASEAVSLGIPSVYAANTSRGYINEQESVYKILVKSASVDWIDIDKAIEKILLINEQKLTSAVNKLRNNTVDVAKFVADCFTNTKLISE
ncbi:MAG: DUF354 domain-containing protein [Gammaproteobacteria bacterium]|nr:DUF354 domain-containing protein [Gammaproteobacteria bacterium]